MVSPGDVLLLEGDLAAGKTTLVRGLVEGLNGNPGQVSSPSFVLIQTYRCQMSGMTRLHHVDLYRLADKVADLREVGIDEVLSDSEAIIAVEWPKETLATWIPRDARVWHVRLTVGEDDERRISVTPPV
jgi:tRNA threonylcarbamoyladenosine biosynthesis protein TsaE